MSEQQLNNLIKMLEQIIANNQHHGDTQQVAAVATDHLQKFWARSMKQQIINFAQATPTALSATAQLSIEQLAAATDNSLLN